MELEIEGHQAGIAVLHQRVGGGVHHVVQADAVGNDQIGYLRHHEGGGDQLHPAQGPAQAEKRDHGDQHREKEQVQRFARNLVFLAVGVYDGGQAHEKVKEHHGLKHRVHEAVMLLQHQRAVLGRHHGVPVEVRRFADGHRRQENDRADEGHQHALPAAQADIAQGSVIFQKALGFHPVFGTNKKLY